jgi:hypothetical protein
MHCSNNSRIIADFTRAPTHRHLTAIQIHQHSVDPEHVLDGLSHAATTSLAGHAADVKDRALWSLFHSCRLDQMETGGI